MQGRWRKSFCCLETRGSRAFLLASYVWSFELSHFLEFHLLFYGYFEGVVPYGTVFNFCAIPSCIVVIWTDKIHRLREMTFKSLIVSWFAFDLFSCKIHVIRTKYKRKLEQKRYRYVLYRVKYLCLRPLDSKLFRFSFRICYANPMWRITTSDNLQNTCKNRSKILSLYISSNSLGFFISDD